MLISTPSNPAYSDFAIFIVCRLLFDDLSRHKKRRLLFDVKKYVWDEHFLFREGAENIISCCLPEVQVNEIVEVCQASPADGHHGGIRASHKVLQRGYYCPTFLRDAHDF